MAALDSTTDLNNLLDTWRGDDQANVSPVATLRRSVFHHFVINSYSTQACIRYAMLEACSGEVAVTVSYLRSICEWNNCLIKNNQELTSK